MKIGIITVYYGKIPECLFKVWLRSCEYNKSVDFFVFTDDNILIPDNITNVRVIKSSLKHFKSLAYAKLKIDNLCVNKVYKVCDFRPAWGVIFEDYLIHYDYWGHCDMDMVFGDLTYYFEKYNLEKYDKFLNYGYLALYRNTPECNAYYKLPGSKVDYLTVFTTEPHYSFDEFENVNSIYIKNNLPIFMDDNILANINPWHTRLMQFGYYYKWCNFKHQIFYWEDGKAWQGFYKDGSFEKKEYIYIHLTHRKYQHLNFSPFETDAFVFCPDKILPKKKGVPTLKEVKSWNPYNPLREFADYIYHGKLQSARKFFRKLSERNILIEKIYVMLKAVIHAFQKFS